MVLHDFINKEFDERIVDILSSQMCVTSSRLDNTMLALDVEDRHIKCAATEIKD